MSNHILVVCFAYSKVVYDSNSVFLGQNYPEIMCHTCLITIIIHKVSENERQSVKVSESKVVSDSCSVFLSQNYSQIMCHTYA